MSSKKENHSRYNIHTNVVTTEQNTDVSLLKDTPDGRIYEIRLVPTIALSVILNKEEAEKNHGSRQHIFGVIQINSDKDFDDVWNAIAKALNKRTVIIAGEKVSAFEPLKLK